MEFSALGPLRVTADGQMIHVGAGRQRAVLAILMLRANQVVPITQLIDGVWGESPPASAPRLIPTYIWQLRRRLGQPAGAGPLIGGPGGYLLQATTDELDITKFERLAAQGRAAVTGGDPVAGSSLLEAALALWRGEPLEDVELQGDYVIDLARLAGQRASIQEERIAADMACSRHSLVITEIEQLLAATPLRESLIGQLMLALHRSGRRADALQTFQLARTRLADELGLDPAAELCRLHQQILADDPALSPSPAPSCDRMSPVPRQLPAAVRHFVGRTAELDILNGLLNQTGQGPVVISAVGGTAGIGKTALAVHWAHQAADRFPGGQLYVNLRGFDKAGAQLTPTEAVRGFLDALGVAPERVPADLNAQAGLYRSLVAGRRILIVLDNARDTGQVRPLLPGSPGCLVLVTSRSQLTGLVAAEGALPLTLGLLTLQEAGALLASRLGPERLAAEPGSADELINLCARLPLALAITAARAEIHPRLALADLAAGLRDAGRRLDALDTCDSDGAASVRTIFSWSYQNLSPPAARMFRLLGVHQGPDIGSLAAASLAGMSRPDADHALAELTRANLVTEPVPGRYAFHDLLRAYGSERAHADDGQLGRRAALGRMLDYYLHAAQSASVKLFPATEPLAVGAPEPGVAAEEFPGPEAAQAWFTAEHSVLLAVIRQAFADGFDTHAWQIPTAISAFLDMQYAWQHWADMQEVALAAARRAGDQIGLAHAYDSLGYARAKTGRFDAAQPLLQLALDLFRELGDCVNQARVHSSLAMMHEWQGDLSNALGHAQQALTLCQATSNRTGQARALSLVGWHYSLLGDDRRALVFCEQALDLHRDLADRAGEAATWDSLGHAHHHLGDHQRAIGCYRKAIDLSEKLGDRYHQAGGLRHLAEASQAAGDPGGARTALQDAVAILDDLHHPDTQQARDQLRDLGQVQADGPEARDLQASTDESRGD